jgi:hypothetical protein
MSSIESLISEIENLTFSDKIVVLEGLSKLIKKGLAKNVKLSKEEKEAKPKRVASPNPWNAFIEKIIQEQSELFEGVAKRSEKVKIVSEYKKEHIDEYEKFSVEFYKVNPKPEKEVKEKKPKAVSAGSTVPTLREKAAKSDDESGNESSSSSKTKISNNNSVTDKAAEIKKKLAEKKASKEPKVNNNGADVVIVPVDITLEEEKPKAKKAIKAITKKTVAKEEVKIDTTKSEESHSEITIKGKKYNFEAKTNHLWDSDWNFVGVYQPDNKKNPIRECEYSEVANA